MGDIDAMAVGLAVWRLGAGRAAPGERVQSGAGLRIHRRPGEPVAAGEALFTLYTDTPERFERRDGGDGRWLERRRRGSRRRPADHRSDHADDHAVDTGQRSGTRRRRCCTTTSTAGCDRPPCSSSPQQTGYDELPATDVDSLATWFRTAAHSGSLGAVPRAVRPHGRGDADARRRCTGWPTSASKTWPPTTWSTRRSDSRPNCTSTAGCRWTRWSTPCWPASPTARRPQAARAAPSRCAAW